MIINRAIEKKYSIRIGQRRSQVQPASLVRKASSSCRCSLSTGLKHRLFCHSEADGTGLWNSVATEENLWPEEASKHLTREIVKWTLLLLLYTSRVQATVDCQRLTMIDPSKCTAVNVSLAINPKVDPNRDHKAWVRSVYDELPLEGKKTALHSCAAPGTGYRVNQELEWRGDSVVQIAITYLVADLQPRKTGASGHVSSSVLRALAYGSSYALQNILGLTSFIFLLFAPLS